MRTARSLTDRISWYQAGGRGACTPPQGTHASPQACTPPPVHRMTNRCKNITLPHTSFVGGNKKQQDSIPAKCVPHAAVASTVPYLTPGYPTPNLSPTYPPNPRLLPTHPLTALNPPPTYNHLPLVNRQPSVNILPSRNYCCAR